MTRRHDGSMETSGPTGVGGPAGLPSLPTVWQPVRTRLVLYALAALDVGYFVWLATAMPPGWPLNDRVGISLVGFFLGGLLTVLARPKIRADREGLTVVNFVRVRRLAWPEVLGVNLRLGDPWAVLDLADGGTIAAVGIQPAAGRAQAVRAARQLLACAEAYGTAPGH
jgi:hypothetical protein